MKTPENVKLFRTLSMVRQNPQKQKEKEINLLATQLGIHPDPKKNLVVCHCYKALLAICHAHSCPNCAITQLN